MEREGGGGLGVKCYIGALDREGSADKGDVSQVKTEVSFFIIIIILEIQVSAFL